MKKTLERINERNKDLKQLIDDSGAELWEVAVEMEVQDSNLSVYLRQDPISPQIKQRIIAAVEKLQKNPRRPKTKYYAALNKHKVRRWEVEERLGVTTRELHKMLKIGGDPQDLEKILDTVREVAGE